MAKERKAKTKDHSGGGFTGETLSIVAFVCLAVGFLLGVAFTVYRADSRAPAPGPMPPRTGQSAASAPGFTDRIAELAREAERRPKDPKIWAELGHHYFDANDYEKAIEAYRKSLDLDPNNADVWTDMGVMYRRSGKPKDAVAAFDRAMAVDPRHEVSRFNKGIVLLHDLNDPEGAIAAWEALVRINPLAMAPNGQSVDELIAHYRDHLGAEKGKNDRSPEKQAMIP